ncbi:transcriptional regulator [Burkholderia sp. Nafp2/4-1b]|uniref:winged helix-turn-helix domain-containing protein n=1 Tax=Burkholderia sp. Nafp2/4-1b TaxID=2116686 RepID=UPI000EF880F3|nr:winged helix-turn-helix domain-containing protein [Burkholderia sp. Nafp2/4-1b]RKT98986.1 transcriptional regulator [Burkholderia sp. Nafp2/4-1b]
MECRYLYVDNVKIDFERRNIEIDGKSVGVTSQEFYIIEGLLDRVSEIVPRAAVQKVTWGCELDASSRALDAHIFRIRAKLHLDEHGGKNMRIVAAYAVGYRLLLDGAVMSNEELKDAESAARITSRRAIAEQPHC